MPDVARRPRDVAGDPLDWVPLAGDLRTLMTWPEQAASPATPGGRHLAAEATHAARRLSQAMGEAGETSWSPAVAGLAADIAGLRFAAGDKGLDRATLAPTILKAMHAAFCIVKGDPYDLPVHERDALATMVVATPALDVGRYLREIREVSAPCHGGGPVRVTFPWRTRRKGARVKQVIAIGHAHVDIVDAPGDSAPVVARLRTPDGGWLDLRNHEGRLLRPVLAPGSWTPIGIDAFAEAASRGHAWRDAPHAAGLTGPHAVLGIGCLGGEPWKIDEASTAALAEARTLVLADVGALVSINGVVHRETPAPTLHVRTSDQSIGGTGPRACVIGVAWRLGDALGMDDDQSTLRGADRIVGEGMAWTGPEGGFHPGVDASLAEVARRWFALGRGEASAAGWRLALDHGTAVADLMEWQFQPARFSAATCILDWARAYLPKGSPAANSATFKAAAAVLGGAPPGKAFALVSPSVAAAAAMPSALPPHPRFLLQALVDMARDEDHGPTEEDDLLAGFVP